MNKSNNDHMGSIIQAFLSFCLLFLYASCIASKKMRPSVTSLRDMLVWRTAISGSYTTKSGYDWLCSLGHV